MKKIIAVIGNANISDNSEKQTLSLALGEKIIDNGFLLATGGLGGVMEFASKGARQSEKYTDPSVIGVLPSYDATDANNYVDIVIPSGMGLARNLLLVSMADAVVAIGGGAGTLSEISLAWSLKKLVIATDVDGWSKEICNRALDNRRKDVIFCAKNADDVIKLLNEKLPLCEQEKFTGF